MPGMELCGNSRLVLGDGNWIGAKRRGGNGSKSTNEECGKELVMACWAFGGGDAGKAGQCEQDTSLEAPATLAW